MSQGAITVAGDHPDGHAHALETVVLTMQRSAREGDRERGATLAGAAQRAALELRRRVLVDGPGPS